MTLFKESDLWFDQSRIPNNKDLRWTGCMSFPILEGPHAGRYLLLKLENMGSTIKISRGNHKQGPNLRKNFQELELLGQSGIGPGPNGKLWKVLRVHKIPNSTVLENPHMYLDRPRWADPPTGSASWQATSAASGRFTISRQMRTHTFEISADFMPHRKSFNSTVFHRFKICESKQLGHKLGWGATTALLFEHGPDWKFKVVKSSWAKEESPWSHLEYPGFNSPAEAFNYMDSYLRVVS